MFVIQPSSSVCRSPWAEPHCSSLCLGSCLLRRLLSGRKDVGSTHALFGTRACMALPGLRGDVGAAVLPRYWPSRRTLDQIPYIAFWREGHLRIQAGRTSHLSESLCQRWSSSVRARRFAIQSTIRAGRHQWFLLPPISTGREEFQRV